MNEASAVRIRKAIATDREFVLDAAARLADFELPHWRQPSDIVEVERKTLSQLFESIEAADGLLVAEDGQQLLGFVFLERHTDFFTGKAHGHISVIVTAKRAEGRGVGALLMDAAEAWARGRAFPFLTLNVFSVNTRARSLYERLEYHPETVKYIKVL